MIIAAYSIKTFVLIRHTYTTQSSYVIDNSARWWVTMHEKLIIFLLRIFVFVNDIVVDVILLLWITEEQGTNQDLLQLIFFVY